ncbi:hypothetical protein BBJ28_00011387 [Nothophytophthora sp. Chile5]|nr:hypothetical protein BBJ28_00011387 [Nothophytophthora sp. Chile5]
MAQTRSVKIANSAAAAHDVDFPHLWRQLQAAGRTSKAPRGLETDWLYVTPNVNVMFTGEYALVEHAFRSGRLDAATTDTTDTSTGKTDTSMASTGTAGPSQIGTSVILSQGTLNALFDSLVAVLLSEASELDSEYEQPDDTPPAVSGRVLRTRVPVKEDVNFVSLAKNMSDYASLSSGASDGEVSEDDDDDDNVDRTGAQDEDDVLSDADSVEMDDAFIEALRIGALDRRAPRAREDTLRSMQRTPVSSAFDSDVPTFAGLGGEEAQPTADLRAVCHSPLKTFLFFMPKSL